MKKLLLFIVSIVTLVSCECPYAWESGYTNPGDSFFTEYLYGTWGSSDLMFGDLSVKTLVFPKNTPGMANVNCQFYPSTKRENITFEYYVVGKYLTFKSVMLDENNKPKYGPYKFKILEFLTCEVTLQDVYYGGKYVMKFENACNTY